MNDSKSLPLEVEPTQWLQCQIRKTVENANELDTYKCPTGFPPREEVGHANQMMPLAAHLRSTFLSMVTRFDPSAVRFLENKLIEGVREEINTLITNL
jgi:hypothetical protein